MTTQIELTSCLNCGEKLSATDTVGGTTVPPKDGDGFSIYDEHLERRGEGLHHVKFYYQDCKKAVADFTRRGYPVIQSGRFDEDEHYYLDTEKDYGYIVELGNAGRIPPAERGFPAS